MPSDCLLTRRSALILGTGLLAAPRVARAADRITVRLDWTPWASQAAYHLAQAKGWYKANDLEVAIEDGNGSIATIQLVGNGQFDIGNASLAPMLIARSKGIPVKAIANIVRQNDIGLIVPDGQGMNTPADLRGKKLGYTPGSLETPFLDRFLAAGGLKRGDVELMSMDAAAKGGTLIAGRVDGVFSAVPFLLPILAAQKPASAIWFAKYGLSFPSFGMVTSERAIAEKPVALKRFASVTAGAWTWLLAGKQQEAAEAMIAARPQSRLSVPVLLKQLALLGELTQTEATKGQPLGIMAEGDMADALKNLGEAGQLDKAEPAAATFTNALLDAGLIAAVARG